MGFFFVQDERFLLRNVLRKHFEPCAERLVMSRGLRTPSGLDGRSYRRLQLESASTSDSTRYELILIRRLFTDCFLQILGCLVFVLLSVLRSLLLQESAHS